MSTNEDAAYSEYAKMITKTLEALRSNRMNAEFLAPEKVCARVEELMFDGAVIASGGSQTVAQCGLEELFRSGRYRYLDRAAAAPNELPTLYRESFFSDFYFTSANAITMDGELFNVDGNSNRVAAICYGPKKVIVVAGCNKIVRDIPEAVERLRAIAAPMNAKRLSCATPCSQTGECVARGADDIADGCGCDARICCNYLISAQQREAGRITVLIVGKDMGF